MQRKIMPLLPATDRVGLWFVTCPVGRLGDQVPPAERENKALCILVHGKGVFGEPSPPGRTVSTGEQGIQYRSVNGLRALG